MMSLSLPKQIIGGNWVPKDHLIILFGGPGSKRILMALLSDTRCLIGLLESNDDYICHLLHSNSSTNLPFSEAYHQFLYQHLRQKSSFPIKSA